MIRRAPPAPLRAALSILLATTLVVQNAWGLGPFEKNHPLVQKGKEAFDKGNFNAALDAFDEARKDPELSAAKVAAVELDRGNALFKLNRYDEAKDAFSRARDVGDAHVKEKGLYNLGNTYQKLNDRENAIRSYRKALTLDPKDDDARHNLEALLRNTPPPQSSPDAGTPPDAGTGDGGQDGGQDGGTDAGSDGGSGSKSNRGGDGGQQDAGSKDGGSQENQNHSSDGGQQKDGGQQDQQHSAPDGGVDAGQPLNAQDGGSVEPGEEQDGGRQLGAMNREEALKLLDSMKQNEKNLQLWKFQPKKPRKANEKDW